MSLRLAAVLPTIYVLAVVSLLLAALAYLAITRVSNATLRRIQPWVSGLQWGAWLLGSGLSTWQLLTSGRSLLAPAACILYGPVMAACGWIKNRVQFEDPPTWNARRMSSLLKVPGPTYVPIKNPSAAAAWYVDKLGLRRLAPTKNSDPNTIRLKFSSDITEEIRLGPSDPLSLGSTVMLHSRRLKRVRQVLSERGVEVGPIQTDRQGTSFFEFHDAEGNTVEVCSTKTDL